MILTQDNIKRIDAILLAGRPYFRKDFTQEPLIVTTNSSDEELKIALKYVAKHLHPDIVNSRTDLTDEEKKARVELFTKINSAIDDLIKGRSPKRINNPKDISIVLSKLFDKYESMPHIPIINYYELFNFDSNMTSENIIASTEYKELKKILILENISTIPEDKKEIYQQLCKAFNDFEKNVLQNKEGRFYYNQLLGLRINQQEKQPNEEINNLLQDFRFMLGEGFVNYYILFSMDASKDRKELLTNNQMVHLTSLLKMEKFTEYNLDSSLRILYESLCKSFRIFTESILASDENKYKYDKGIKERESKDEKAPTDTQDIKDKQYTENYRYIFKKAYVDPTEVVSQNVRPLNKAIEVGIKNYGVSLTVLLIKKLFHTKDINVIGPVMGACFKKDITKEEIRELYNELVPRYRAPGYGILAEKVVTELLSRKTDILINAIKHTAGKKGKKATIIALQNYIKQGEFSGFAPGNETTIGREKIMMEIRPDFIKYVLAILENKTLLLDFPDHIHSQYNDSDSILEIVYNLVETKNKGFKGFRK